MKEKLLKVKEALECSIEAFEKTVLYSTNDGVWINSRIKGSAMWGLQDCEDNIKSAFAESASLNAKGMQECKESLDLIDTILAELHDKESLEKMINKYNCWTLPPGYKEMAKAIEAIKDEANG